MVAALLALTSGAAAKDHPDKGQGNNGNGNGRPGQTTTTTAEPAAQTTAQPTASEVQPAAAPRDRCDNLPGDQRRAPTGYAEEDRYCYPANGDWCSNISGGQGDVPSGYTVNDEGQCVRAGGEAGDTTDSNPPAAPQDVCSNIPGNQTYVPEGMTASGGQCRTEDQCPNLGGYQSEVPQGYELQEGNCIREQQPVTPTPTPTPETTPAPETHPDPKPDPSTDTDTDKPDKDAVDCDDNEREVKGKCVAKTTDINTVSPDLALVAPDGKSTGDDLGDVELDETGPETLADGPRPKVDNPLFPWLSFPALVALVLVPLILTALFFYLAVHRPRRRERVAAAPADPDMMVAPAAAAAEPMPMIVEPMEIDEADLIPPQVDPNAALTQPMPPVDPAAPTDDQ